MHSLMQILKKNLTEVVTLSTSSFTCPTYYILAWHMQEFKEQKESILSGESKIILGFYLTKLEGTLEDCQTC